MQPNLLRNEAPLCVQAKQEFMANGLPAAKNEAWIYTRLSDITINPAGVCDDSVSAQEGVLSFAAGWLCSGADTMPACVTIAAMGDDEVLAQFAAHLPEEHLLGSLSLGHATGAYCITIDEGAVMDAPLQLVFDGGDEGESSHPLIFIRCGARASAKIAEIHAGGSSLSAPVMVMEVGEGAKFDHVKLQAEADDATHLALSVFAVAESADVNSFTAAIGAVLGRHETHAHLNGEHIDMALSSLYLARGAQHQDITTKMLHHMPNCTSNQIIRGVLDDTAKGVFQGKVLVARDAQKTDGQQMSRALLLSRKAEADAKPELEIYADDVVCSHGATVGELDETHMFYLKSRGIGEDEARNMLIEAFLLDALEQVRDGDLADILSHAVQGWMAENEGKKVA